MPTPLLNELVCLQHDFEDFQVEEFDSQHSVKGIDGQKTMKKTRQDSAGRMTPDVGNRFRKLMDQIRSPDLF